VRHERSRVYFRAPTHFKESGVFFLVIFDEDHILADMKINDVADACVDSVFSTLPIDKSDSSTGTNYCQPLSINNLFCVKILSDHCSLELKLVLKGTIFVNQSQYFFINLPYQDREHGDRYIEDLNCRLVLCYIEYVLWGFEHDVKLRTLADKKKIRHSRRRSRMGDHDIRAERRLVP
jgi:hypothetical protein